MCGGSVLGVPSKFIKTLSKQLCDSTHVFLEAEPTLIYIQVLHSSFLLWCCFWKKKRCETDCFLSGRIQAAVCTPAQETVWAQLGLAIGGGGNRTRVSYHLLQTLQPRFVPLSSFMSPTLFTTVNKLHVKLYNWFCSAGLQRGIPWARFPVSKVSLGKHLPANLF